MASAQGAPQLCRSAFTIQALCSMAPFMAKTLIFLDLNYSGISEKAKTVKLGNQTVMIPQAVGGTGIMIGPETGLMGVQEEWERGVHMLLTKNFPCMCHSRN